MKTFISITLLVVFAAAARAQDHQLYASGHFPKGHIYTETELPSLIGRDFHAPAYLVGQFIFLGKRSGTYLFANFTPRPPGNIEFGKILVQVNFYGNVPPTLDVGKIIQPSSADPLSIRSVNTGQGYLFVTTESWSEP